MNVLVVCVCVRALTGLEEAASGGCEEEAFGGQHFAGGAAGSVLFDWFQGSLL